MPACLSGQLENARILCFSACLAWLLLSCVVQRLKLSELVPIRLYRSAHVFEGF